LSAALLPSVQLFFLLFKSAPYLIFSKKISKLRLAMQILDFLKNKMEIHQKNIFFSTFSADVGSIRRMGGFLFGRAAFWIDSSCRLAE